MTRSTVLLLALVLTIPAVLGIALAWNEREPAPAPPPDVERLVAAMERLTAALEGLPARTVSADDDELAAPPAPAPRTAVGAPEGTELVAELRALREALLELAGRGMAPSGGGAYSSSDGERTKPRQDGSVDAFCELPDERRRDEALFLDEELVLRRFGRPDAVYVHDNGAESWNYDTSLWRLSVYFHHGRVVNVIVSQKD